MTSVRYLLACGHAVHLDADAADAALTDPKPTTPYRWCDACARWEPLVEHLDPDDECGPDAETNGPVDQTHTSAPEHS